MASILIIDDDEQVLKLMMSYLEDGGHELSSAKNGKQGIMMLESQQFDLVITDIIMPENDGLEVLLFLLKRAKRPKVIAVSGGSPNLGQADMLTLAQGLKADKVLPKPITSETLNQTVAEVMTSIMSP